MTPTIPVPVDELPGWIRTLIDVGAILGGTLFVVWVLRWLVGRFVRRLTSGTLELAEHNRKRAQTITLVLRAVITVLLLTIALLLALSRAGINIAPLLAAAGVGGVAIGFGAQNIVRDTLEGIFILVEDQFHVGDVVKVADVSGVVEKITLRTTTLRGLDGRVHSVPNGEIRVSTNLTKGYSRYLIDLPVPYEADIDGVTALVRDVVEKMRMEEEYAPAILGPLEVLGVDDYGPSEILLKMYVNTLPGRQWVVGRELRRRIKKAYDEAGISIPYPHREVIVKDGSKEAKTG